MNLLAPFLFSQFDFRIGLCVNDLLIFLLSQKKLLSKNWRSEKARK